MKMKDLDTSPMFVDFTNNEVLLGAAQLIIESFKDLPIDPARMELIRKHFQDAHDNILATVHDVGPNDSNSINSLNAVRAIAAVLAHFDPNEMAIPLIHEITRKKEEKGALRDIATSLKHATKDVTKDILAKAKYSGKGGNA
jgi:hypothetical protein